MQWSSRRKTLYTTSALLVFAGLISLIVFVFKDRPTCSDGVRNQDEIAIDCGGSCVRVCKEEVSPLIVRWSRLFAVRPGVYDVGAYVENPNTGFGIAQLSYEFRIYDARNVLISAERGVTYANAGEQFFIYEPRVDVGKSVPKRAFLEIVDPEWTRTSGKKNGVISVESKTYTSSPNPRLSALVSYRGDTSVRNLEAYSLLTDEAGSAIAVGRTFIDRIEKNQSAGILFTWPETFASSPTVYDIFVRFPFTQ